MGQTAGKPVAIGLLLMPSLKGRVDGDETDVPADLRSPMERRLAEADDGDAERGACLVESGVLEMAQHEGVVAPRACHESVVDRLCGAPELRDSSEVAVAGRHPVDVDGRSVV